MNIGWPQGILLSLLGLRVLLHLVNDGTLMPERSQHFAFEKALAQSLLLLVIIAWGGFFA